MDNKEREEVFERDFKEKIADFIDKPEVKDLIVVEKELEINLDKLRALKLKQLGSNYKDYVIRVCK